MDASWSPRLLTELTRGQSLRLLAGVRFGRIVFTHRALPAIRPVNHLLDGEDIVIRTHPGAIIAAPGLRPASWSATRPTPSTPAPVWAGASS